MTSQAELIKTYDAHKKAFIALPYPSYQARKQSLVLLKKMIIQSQTKLAEALNEDFGGRNHHETQISECLPTVSQINYILKHLKHWMKPNKRKVSLLHWPSKNRVFYQPKGVVGITVPWNYPLFLSMVPLAYALAAGNRVLLKLSEHTPCFNTQLHKILDKYSQLNSVSIITGDASIGEVFSRLPLDHLFFTGSTHVGTHVMRAASEHLTPVTLELGGKSPTVVDQGGKLAMDAVAKKIVFAKALNAGQTCIAPDYIYCHEALLDSFTAAIKKSYDQLHPNPELNSLTSIINDTQYQRLTDYLKDAKAKGACIETLGNLTDCDEKQNKHMPFTLVTKVRSDMLIMQHEIFGPLLPLIGFNNLDDVVTQINHQPRPLALYYFGNTQNYKQLLQNTHSGSVCFNEALMQVAQDDLPFGGIGASGMGAYHGIEGFLTFSHSKGVHQKGKLSFAHLAYPPYKEGIKQWLLRHFIH